VSAATPLSLIPAPAALVPRAARAQRRFALEHPHACAACGGPLRPEEVRARQSRLALETQAEARGRAQVRALAMAAREDAAELRAQAVTLTAYAIAILHVAENLRRVSDLPAEQIVLGWALSGRARLAELADIEPRDFTGPGHRDLFALAWGILEGGGRPSPALVLRVVGLDPCGWPTDDIEAALERLPRPASCPRLEMELMAALSRGWRA